MRGGSKGMRKRIMTFFVVVLTGLFFLTVGVLTAADLPTKPKKKIFLIEHNNGYKTKKGKKRDKKGPVKLTHEKHNKEYKVACTECHHEYKKEGKKNINTWKEGDPTKKCEECHFLDAKKAKKKKVKSLNLAYHKNCKDCHKKIKKENKGKKKEDQKKTGPVKKCKKCHQKKKK